MSRPSRRDVQRKKRHRLARVIAGKTIALADRAVMLCAFRETCPHLGDSFEDIAGALGWDSGTFWRQNPAIAIARTMWARTERKVAA